MRNANDPSERHAAAARSELLTAADLEREYGIKQGTQRAWRARRLIPFIRLGGGRMIRYERAAIERFIASRSVPAKDDRPIAPVAPIGLARAKRAGASARPVDGDDDDGHGPAVAS